MNSSTATPTLTWNAPVSSWWSVRCAKGMGRLIMRPVRFVKRHFWKISLATTLLITAAWQYENWHGRQALAEQRALWIEEYGEMKLEDYITPPVPDDENFLTAPIFEKWAQPINPPSADADESVIAA